MKDETIETNGLRPLPEDLNDFSLGSVLDLPALSEIPEAYTVGLPSIAHQKKSDFCAGAASCSISELQEGVPLSYEWVFAVSRVILGEDNWGCDLRTICKVHTKYGAPERSEVPYSLDTHSPDFLRKIENYPEDLFNKALKHKKKTYFAVNGPYDAYDNIRATMWHFRQEKCGVLFGVMWAWSIKQVYMNEVPKGGFGHAMAQIGWTEKGMFVQNSMGAEAGEEGRHYFTRELVNKFVARYGAFIFIDMPREDAEWYIQNGVKLTDHWLVGLLKAFWKLITLQ